MNGADAISVRGLVKEFGSGATTARALGGVDLDVAFGGITMLVGPSGCGKTTLLSIASGLLAPTTGSVSVLGIDPFSLSEGERAAFRRTSLGFIFQQYGLIACLSAVENAAVSLVASGVRRREAHERAAAVLAQLGLGERLDFLPRELSGGQQQRVAVARALVHEPKLVLCDEPTAALDARSGHAVMEMMAAIAVRPDRAVVVVTHDQRIHEFAQRIVAMEDGRIVEVADAESDSIERDGGSAS
jgi:putative ABC transport system ATP-binding protein